MRTVSIAWSLLLASAIGMSAPRVVAEIDCGDGSDGAFAPTESIEIDLSLALPGHWKDTPGDGNGVYDKDKWAVVFKYSSIDIRAGVTVTFRNHPSNPPVVWLSQGDVNISGIVSLNGRDGAPATKPVLFARPGPGGFDGGRRSKSAIGVPGSAGFGPGGGQCATNSNCGGTGGGGGGGHWTYGTEGSSNCGGGGGGGGGAPYGSNLVQPLLGGSGGGTNWPQGNTGGGGAGGGAIAIASCGTLLIGSSGRIDANGGAGASGAGGGSGGTIRLIATQIKGSGELNAFGGAGGSAQSIWRGGGGSVGWIRLEADDSESFNGATNPDWIPAFPTILFAQTTPALWISKIDGVDVARDPLAGIKTLEAEIDNPNPVTVEVMAKNVKAGTKVTIIVIPGYGGRYLVTSTDGLVDNDDDGVFTVKIEGVTIPPGRAEVQLRANWTN